MCPSLTATQGSSGKQNWVLSGTNKLTAVNTFKNIYVLCCHENRLISRGDGMTACLWATSCWVFFSIKVFQRTCVIISVKIHIKCQSQDKVACQKSEGPILIQQNIILIFQPVRCQTHSCCLLYSFHKLIPFHVDRTSPRTYLSLHSITDSVEIFLETSLSVFWEFNFFTDIYFHPL